MGITCPNKKLKEFKDLVTIHGENASYSLWNEYEGNVPERFYKGVAIEYSLPSQQLPKKLQEFLDKLNFTVEFKDDLLHEYNPISLTDLLYKTILIKQDYKLEGLLKESAYVAYSFLGKKNKIRTDLVRSIENIQNYQTIFGEYKQKNPNLNDYKIKELIVIDFIADAIKNEFNTPSDSYQNRKADYWQIQGNSKLEKQIKYYLGKIKQFIENLFADTRLNREDLNALIADIANDIINQNFDKFGTLLSKEQQLTNYEKTIERDKKADEIVKNFQNLGLLLTGSLALRRQGTLYRSVNEDLHDLDFSATKELHGEYFNNLVIELEKSMEGASEQGSYFLKEAFAKRLDKEYLKHPILNKIKELYPTFKVTNTFLSTTEKNELTISGDIDGYAIDLFFVNPEKLDNNEKGFQDWQPIFEAKIKMGRAKDIRDFANYIPFNKKTNVKFGDIKGFRHFNFGNKISSNKDESIDGAVSDFSAEIQYQKQTASIQNQPFDKKLHKKIENKLKKLYPEIKLEYSNNPSWVKDGNVFNQKSQLDNEINYRLKAVDILLSDKAKQVFAKGEKAKWDLNKILTELQIPKEQKALLLDINSQPKLKTKEGMNPWDDGANYEDKWTREQLALELASKYSYSVEVNTAKNKIYSERNWDLDEDIPGSEEEFEQMMSGSKEEPFQYYSNLTVPGGTNYTENEISTPLITPSIKGHAQFSTDNGIGWFRSDDKAIPETYHQQGEFEEVEDEETGQIFLTKKTQRYGTPTKTRRVLELQSDLFQKGRDKKDLVDLTTTEPATEQEFENAGLNGKVIYSGRDGGKVVEYDNVTYDREIHVDYVDGGSWASYSKVSLEKKLELNNNNQFLQLLNKNSNWVTFFIKSIIQDSAKKGYEKVLFPSGETAAKIEGHETIAEEIKKVDDDLKKLQNENFGISTGDYGYVATFRTELEAINYVEAYDTPPYEKIDNSKQIVELEKKKSELKSQGIEKLKPIEAFYEIKVGNILEKQFGKDNVKTTTDEYGNQWREITINQARDLQDILLQKNEADRIIGQANIKALTVLIDAVNQKQDTLPHEYAHHYIAWNRNSPIVKEAIKKWGSEEALVQSIGEQAVKQKGDAWNWWKKFVKWLLGDLNKLSTLKKEELTNILTDAFLTRQDLNDLSDSSFKRGREVIPLSERPDLYKAFKLLDSKGEIITYPTKSAGIKRLNGLNKSSELYDFDIRKTDPDEKWIIFPLRPIANLEPVAEEDSPMVDDRELYDTTGDMAKYGGDMFQLPPNKRQEVIQSVDDKLKSIISDIGIKIVPYEELKEKYTGDAYGFTKLLAGNSEIGIAALRDKFTLSEESGHIYFEMLRTTPFYDRVLNELEKEDYYKTILDIDGNYQRYYDEYKGNKLALKREAAGKLLGKTLFTKTEALVNQPTGIRLLLARIKDFLKKAIAKFNYNTIKPEIDLLMGEIADNALKGTMSNLGGDVENILNTGEKLYRIKDNLEEQKKLTTKMLESVIKRQQFYKLRDDLEQFEKYQQKERELLKLIDEVKHLEGISFYLDSLKDELNDFNEKLNKSIEIYSEDKPFTPERIRKDSKSLKNMKFVVDANLTTVGAIVKELSSQYRYSKDDAAKESLKAILDEARMIESNFKEADNIYSDLGTTIVSAFLTPLLGNRNSQDLLDKVNFGRPENRQLKPLNIKDALHLTEGDINMVSRWMDALADTDDGILQLIDMAVKNQKIKSDEESLNDQKDLIDAQKKLNEGGIKSTEFMAETYNGKATGYFVTEANWGEFYAERDIFFNDLNKHIKDTYDIDSYKEFKQLGDPEDVKVVKSKIAKFYSKYTLSSSPENTYFNKLNARIQRETGFETYMDLKASSPEKAASYAKDISLFFQIQGSQFAETANDVDTLLEEKRNSMSEEEFILWQYFNTREDEYTGEITILKNKNKQYQAIQNNPAQKEYYNTILKMKYELDMLLPEKKRHPRRMIQIKKDWMERLKDATTSMDKEGLTNIMREIGETFKVAEDADDRGVKFALSTDASKVVKFLPIYYINKLKNTSELSMDITGTMAVYSTMARDFAAMNEIVDTLEIARDLIDNREILSTDSKGNPVVESLKGSNIKMIRRITKQQGKSLSADRLAGYMDMMLYGELKADEGRLGVIIDTFTKYSAITSLGLNLFAGIANLNSGFSQMRHQALSNEYFGEKSTLYADKNYWQDIGNIVSGIGRLDNRSVITGQTAKINLWRQHMNIQMDRKGDAKSLDAERKTMLGRLFDTSALFFINNIGEHYIQTRTSLALANNYRYDKKLNKFVWREEYFAEVNKLDLKRRQEIKELGKKPTKQDIKKVNSKYKALSEKLTNDLEASWKDMTNYYEAHENVNNRLKLKEGFKSNLEDKQKFIHRTNALNKEFHGIYNDVDKNELQKYTLFRLAWQFRKWMVPYWNRRYGKGMYHAEKGDYQEGFYKVVGRFIKQMYTEVKLGEFSLRKNWNMLSQQEKANFYKVMSEVGHILGFMALAALLTAGADDDEDNWWLQMGAYQANRAVTELGSMSLPWGIQEGLKIIDQPFAGVSHIKNLSTLAAPWDWFDELERGRYEGYTKFERMLIKGTPGLSQVKDWAYPEEKMVFYTGSR